MFEFEKIKTAYRTLADMMNRVMDWYEKRIDIPRYIGKGRVISTDMFGDRKEGTTLLFKDPEGGDSQLDKIIGKELGTKPIEKSSTVEYLS